MDDSGAPHKATGPFVLERERKKKLSVPEGKPFEVRRNRPGLHSPRLWLGKFPTSKAAFKGLQPNLPQL